MRRIGHTLAKGTRAPGCMHFKSGSFRDPQFVGRPVGGKTTARHPEWWSSLLDAADVVQVSVTTPEHGRSLVRFTPEVRVSAPCTASLADERPDFQGPRFRLPPAHSALTCNALCRGRRYRRSEGRSIVKSTAGVTSRLSTRTSMRRKILHPLRRVDSEEVHFSASALSISSVVVDPLALPCTHK